MILQSSMSQLLTRILSSLTAPKLQRIFLKLSSLYFEDLDASWAAWMEVDRILDSKKFGSLRGVKIQRQPLSRIHVYNPRDVSVHQRLVDHFPLLISRGLLEIEIK
jgi:hypothetical protein